MDLDKLRQNIKKIKQLKIPVEQKQGLLTALRRKYLKPLACTTPWAFAEYCIKDDRGNYLRLQDFHKEWLKIYQNEKRILIEAPTGSGKTILSSIVWPLYVLATKPNTTILLGMKTAKQARKTMRSCMSYISRSPSIHEIFPELKPMKDSQRPWQEMQWSKRDGFIVNRESYSKDFSMEPIGTDSSSSGNRCRLLILDNVLDDKNTRSREACEKVNDWYDAVADSRLFEDSQQIIIDTPWVRSDLLSHVEARGDFYVRKYSLDPADKDSDDYIYINWEEQFSEEHLDNEKRYKPDTYKRQRRSRTVLDEEKEFEHENIKINNKLETDTWLKYIGIDLATKKRKGTCILTISISPDSQTKCVEDVQFGKWSAPDRADKIKEAFEMFNPVKTMVEDNAMQEDDIDWMNAAGYKHLRLEGTTTTGRNKYAYIDSLVVEVRNRMWVFKAPSHVLDENNNLRQNLKHNHCDWCRFITEVLDYPDSVTDDGLMAWSISNRGVKNTRLNIRSSILEDNKIIKKRFDISSYRCYNKISERHGFEPPEDYEEIVEAIKEDKDLSMYSEADVTMIKKDMKRYVRILNEQF